MENRGLAVHRTIVAVDVEGFGDQRRSNRNQLAIRDGLYRAMCEAFRDAEIPWVDRDHEDRGDGMFILVSSEVPKSLFVESLPSALVSALRRHNDAHPDLERIRLRLALHAGEVNYDEHGATAAAINLTFRLLESGPVKEALASYSGVLAVITSSWFFEEVVRHSAANAAAYHPVSVAVKETATTGWIYLPDCDDWAGTTAASTLGGIERHDATPLSGWPDRQSEADFLARYRRHVIEYHGMLEPPDFEYRRRIPVAELYVPPAIVQVIRGSPQLPPRGVTLEQFSEDISRTVLLGDPGGGKTTAAQVLMHNHAAKANGRVPFMVTLREFAAIATQRSVAGYLQDRLESFYQCPAPPGSVERLLLSGAALVIFDGLDELADTTHRGNLTAIIERFCAEYPRTPVLVTSRQIGYEQAQLDNRQFTRYRLGGFDDQQVADYVGKWFAQEDELLPEEAGRQAAAFLAESESLPDLRANPLMLALMCVLYRGEGSMPRNRPDVYAQCTALLFRKWDARRHIDIQLRARSQAEPAIRHLAYWVLTRGQEQLTVTEPELLRETSAFLYDQGFEDGDDAFDAAQEFTTFCRNRAWVFSDAGTTTDGRRLYAFTHRTFLEYFVAAHLAAACDSPEDLARELAPRIARQQWEVVAELAVQIKSNNSDRGAQRIYAVLLGDDSRSLQDRSNILQFLARCARFIEPPPRTVRDLTRAALDHLFGGDISDETRYLPLSWLLASCVSCCGIVKDELATRIGDMIPSCDQDVHLNGLRLAIWVSRGAVFLRHGRLVVPAKAPEHLADFWDDFACQNAKSHAADIAAAASSDEGMLYACLRHRFLTVGKFLATTGSDLSPLFTNHQAVIFNAMWTSYLDYLVGAATRAWGRAVHSGLPRASEDSMNEDFAAVGQFLLDHPNPPWLSIHLPSRWEPVSLFGTNDFVPGSAIFETKDAIAYLGAAASILIAAEMTRNRILPEEGDLPLGAFSSLYPYILLRWGHQQDTRPPELPVPEQFQRLFRTWATQSIDFIRYPADLGSSMCAPS
jgi:NACHT domain